MNGSTLCLTISNNMGNLQNCEISGIEVNFEKMLIKWDKVPFVLFSAIAIIGVIATMANSQDWGILFVPLILFFFMPFLII